MSLTEQASMQDVCAFESNGKKIVVLGLPLETLKIASHIINCYLDMAAQEGNDDFPEAFVFGDENCIDEDDFINVYLDDGTRLHDAFYQDIACVPYIITDVSEGYVWALSTPYADEIIQRAGLMHYSAIYEVDGDCIFYTFTDHTTLNTLH